MDITHYTYRVTWSPEDGQYVGLCAELPSLSWLADGPGAALQGIMQVTADCVQDLRATGEPVPAPLADRTYTGKFMVRVPPSIHRKLALEAAEKGISMNRLANAKLAL